MVRLGESLVSSRTGSANALPAWYSYVLRDLIEHNAIPVNRPPPPELFAVNANRALIKAPDKIVESWLPAIVLGIVGTVICPASGRFCD